MDPASGARCCLGAQRLRLLRELAGAHRRVPPAFFVSLKRWLYCWPCNTLACYCLLRRREINCPL